MQLFIGFIWLFFIPGSWAAPAAVATPQGYDHSVSVKDSLFFHWKIEGKNIKVMLRAKTEGWVGIGFNPEKEMKGASFVLGYVKDGKAKIEHHFGYRENDHKKSTQMGGKVELTNSSGKLDKGLLEIQFTKALDTGDPTDKKLNPTGDTIVLLAMGATPSFFRQHQLTSRLKINLATGVSKVELIK